jgi:hypothetical protein
MNGLHLCEKCKGLFVSFGSDRYPRFCIECSDILNKSRNEGINEVFLPKNILPSSSILSKNNLVLQTNSDKI